MQSPDEDKIRLFPKSKSDDLSSYAHRQLIGYVGLFLPLLLYLTAGWRPVEGLPRWELLGSISAYYYTGAVAFFCGALVALGLFLYTYHGYRNSYNVLDRVFAVIAGTAAILVALFPTGAPTSSVSTPWWIPAMGYIHYTSAVVFFLCLVVFSVYLFTRPGQQKETVAESNKGNMRNYIYVFCGVAILACLLWALLAGVNKWPIFWPEAFSLWFFSISWLVKGRAEITIANGVSILRHPRKTARYLRNAIWAKEAQ